MNMLKHVYSAFVIGKDEKMHIIDEYFVLPS